MYRVSGVIEGVAPFLFNRMSEAAQDKLRSGSAGGRKTDEQRSDEARDKAYTGPGGLYLPAWNLKKCLLEGVQRAGLKEGRAGMRPFVEATVFIDGDLLFGKDEPDFMHEVVGRVPPRTGAAMIVRRPALATGWKLPFALTVVDDRRDPDALRRGLEEAGLLVGLGSWRPEYGRFVVREWTVDR